MAKREDELSKKKIHNRFLCAEPEMDVYFYRAGWVLTVIILGYIIETHIAGAKFILRLPPCPFHALTGFYCFGCGGGRAMSAIAHGRLLMSAVYNPFYLYAVMVGGWFMLSQTMQRISRQKWMIALHYRTVYLLIGVGLLILNFIIKNGLLLAGIRVIA